MRFRSYRQPNCNQTMRCTDSHNRFRQPNRNQTTDSHNRKDG